MYCNEIYWGQHNLVLVAFWYCLGFVFSCHLLFSFQFPFPFVLAFGFFLCTFAFSSYFHYLLTNASVLLPTFYMLSRICMNRFNNGIWTELNRTKQKWTELHNSNNNNYTFNSLEWVLLPSFAVCVSDFITIHCSSSTIHSMCANTLSHTRTRTKMRISTLLCDVRGASPLSLLP